MLSHKNCKHELPDIRAVCFCRVYWRREKRNRNNASRATGVSKLMEEIIHLPVTHCTMYAPFIYKTTLCMLLSRDASTTAQVIDAALRQANDAWCATDIRV